MAARPECTGAVIRHDVPLDDGARTVIGECTDCGLVVIGDDRLDERHAGALVLAVEG